MGGFYKAGGVVMKLLAVLPRVPYPLEKGDKLRAYYLLRTLAEEHEVMLFCLTDKPVSQDTIDHLQSWCKEVVIFRQSKISIATNVLRGILLGEPLQVGYYFNLRAFKALKQLADRIQPDHAFFQLLRTARYAKALPHTPKTLDYMDAFSQGMKRRAQQTAPPLRWVWRYESRRLAAFEKKAFPWFDHHTVISEQDRSFINHPQRDQIQIITNGIDLERFDAYPHSKDIDLIFTGNMAYPPNVLASRFIVNEIMPLLLDDFPGLKVALVGTDPVSAVRELASDHVLVTGWVDEMSDYYARSRILLAPMQIGAGLQNKILEAMALKLPCVVSPIAHRAMNADTKSFITVCETPQEYATVLSELLTHPERQAQRGEAGYEYVRTYHNWQQIGKKLAGLMTAKQP